MPVIYWEFSEISVDQCRFWIQKRKQYTLQPSQTAKQPESWYFATSLQHSRALRKAAGGSQASVGQSMVFQVALSESVGAATEHEEYAQLHRQEASTTCSEPQYPPAVGTTCLRSKYFLAQPCFTIVPGYFESIDVPTSWNLAKNWHHSHAEPSAKQRVRRAMSENWSLCWTRLCGIRVLR